ncbi:hypothetical protein V2J09_000584 [Rumex salicifolius]
MLVYEFVPNNTMEFHLHGHPKIIHRNIKAANILVDYRFEAMVADVALAKFSSDAKHTYMNGCLVDWARPSLARSLEDDNFDDLIVRALEGDVSLSDFNEGIGPGQSTYKEDMKKFRATAFASQEHGSREYGWSTNEYGLYPSGSNNEGQTTREMATREMEMGR